MSGGIDSPVAAHMMFKRGFELILLHMDNRPFTDDKEFEKVIKLANHISETGATKIPCYVAKHGMIAQGIIAKSCDRHLHCIICRRMMLRIAEKLAIKEGASCIITGESLGQVASQTLQNLGVEEEVVSLPILRPLIGLDKTEIMSMARMNGTYSISTSSGLCCTIVPEKPSTKAKLERVKNEEKKLDIQSIVEEQVKNLITL